MTAPSRYVLDSNVFIQAARLYYAFDLVPSFWHALVNGAENGRLRSIDRVKAEIDRGRDMLKDWANSDFRQWFVSTNRAEVVEAYRQIMGWALRQTHYTSAARAEFSRASNADAWVVACSMADQCVAVTHEQLNPDIGRKIPIPNVCLAFDVPYVDTFQMLRDLGVRLGG